jgi:hypothetical protein
MGRSCRRSEVVAYPKACEAVPALDRASKCRVALGGLTLLACIQMLGGCRHAPATPPRPPPGPTAATPDPVQGAPSPLAVFAEGWELNVGDVLGATLLYDSRLRGIGRVHGDQVELLPTQALPHAEATEISLYGTWPTNFWAEVQYGYGRRAGPYRWNGSSWASVDPTEFAFSEFGSRLLSPSLRWTWRHGEAIIAPLENHSDGSPTRRVIERDFNPRQLLATDRGEFVALGMVGRGPSETWAIEYWPAGAQKGVVQPLPPGPPWVGANAQARLCAAPSRRMFVLRGTYGHASPAQVIHAIEFVEGRARSVVEVPNPPYGLMIAGCTSSSDGALWIAFAGDGDYRSSQLVRLGPEGELTDVALPLLRVPPKIHPQPTDSRRGSTMECSRSSLQPPGFFINGLHASTDGQLWVAGSMYHCARDEGRRQATYVRTVVLRSGPARAGGKLIWEKLVGASPEVAAAPTTSGHAAPPPPPPAKSASPVPAASAPPPPSAARPLIAATSDCHPVFVAFYTVQSGTPANYDFPQARSALRGQREFAGIEFVEIQLKNRRVFGAIAPNYLLGQRLAALVQSKVAGSAPQLLCGDPVILRVVPMHIGGGP